MAPRPAYDAALLAVREEWNRAEKAIKLAEQVNGEIVNPAVYELRYAGRRMMEAFAESDQSKAMKLLEDAHFDCLRARHDAIDAATSKISADLDLSVQHLGADVVLTHFSQLPSLIFDLGEVRDKIAVSREKRDERDQIYSAIENDHLGALVTRYRQFKSSEPLLRESARIQRRNAARNSLFGWGGFVFGAIAILFTIYVYLNPLPPPVTQSQPTAESPST
jgi:hypothetical protein